MRFRLFKKIVVIGVAVLLVSCSSDPAPPPPLSFNVTSESRVNGGALFYLVVRHSTEKQFMLESYQAVASKAFADPPDPEVAGVFSIVPGTVQQCEVKPPAQGGLALYFLLTQPGSQWKKLLSMPLSEQYNIRLKASGQIDVNLDKPWYHFF